MKGRVEVELQLSSCRVSAYAVVGESRHLMKAEVSTVIESRSTSSVVFGFPTEVIDEALRKAENAERERAEKTPLSQAELLRLAELLSCSDTAWDREALDLRARLAATRKHIEGVEDGTAVIHAPEPAVLEDPPFIELSEAEMKELLELEYKSGRPHRSGDESYYTEVMHDRKERLWERFLDSEGIR